MRAIRAFIRHMPFRALFNHLNFKGRDMSVIVWGTRCCGRTDNVPGVCYVTTQFSHVQHLPLVPQRSFVVIDGTEDGGDFRGQEIPIESKSMWIGYVRGWAAGLAVGSGLLAVPTTVSYYVASPASTFWSLGALVIFGLAIWCIIEARSWWFLPVQLLMLAVSVDVGWEMATRPSQVQPEQQHRQGVNDRPKREPPRVLLIVLSNVFASFYTATRFGQRATPERAIELANHLGISRDELDKRVDLATMTPRAQTESNEQMSPLSSESSATSE